MAKITNNTRGTMDFITGVQDGVAVTDSVKAGETKEVNLMDPNDPVVRGRILAGAISINGGSPALAAVASTQGSAAAKADRRVATTLAGDVPVKG